MKTIFKSFTLNFLFLFGMFCFNSCCDGDRNSHNILYYYREAGSINSYVTYHDYLIVDNYKDGLMSIKQFEEIAKSYIDTVKADKPVSSIKFVGRAPCGKLPKGNSDNWWKQKKYFLIMIGFDNAFERNKNNKEIQPGFIGFFGKNDASYTDQLQIDSLLNLKTKLFTGF